jgi:paraquat-inducible protein B
MVVLAAPDGFNEISPGLGWYVRILLFWLVPLVVSAAVVTLVVKFIWRRGNKRRTP